MSHAAKAHNAKAGWIILSAFPPLNKGAIVTESTRVTKNGGLATKTLK
jgi:hypothetical protein